MKKSLTIIFILLNIHLFIVCEDHCKDYSCTYARYGPGYCTCVKCVFGYYLEKHHCYKNFCVEGKEEDSCADCNSNNGRCYACYNKSYAVYERYKCKKPFLNCGNNTIKNCQECEIVFGNETGNCKKCYSGYIKSNNTCELFHLFNNMDKIKVNKFLIYFIILFLLLIN